MTAATPGACREYICVALRALATGAQTRRAAGITGSRLRRSVAGAARRSRRRAGARRAGVVAASGGGGARGWRGKAEAEAAAAAAARAGAPFVPPPEVSCAAQMATATASPAEAEGAALDGGAFAARVYAELVHLKEDDALLSLPPAPLERFLAEKGAFAVAQQGGALTQPQARHLELLAKLYRRKGRDARRARLLRSPSATPPAPPCRSKSAPRFWMWRCAL